jgi:DNA-binding NarL/FixJ family response regulator
LSKINTIKVIVADASFLIRKGLRTLLEENNKFEWLGESYDIKGLEGILKKKVVQVLIIDYSIKYSFSISEIENIKSKYPSLNILVISNEKNADEIKKIINLGIKNYLLKDCDEKEIHDAIVACSKGQKYFCGQIIDSLLERELLQLNNCATGSISERETEVINMLVEGNCRTNGLELSYHCNT